MVSFTLNDKRVSVDAQPTTPLLWVIRDHVGLTGTKYGCGAGLCGACTVHLNGKAVRACQTQMSEVTGKKVVTIEGLSPDRSHPVQAALIAEQAEVAMAMADVVVLVVDASVGATNDDEAVVRLLRRTKKPVLLVASSDLNHFDDQETSRIKDQLALDAVVTLLLEREVVEGADVRRLLAGTGAPTLRVASARP